MKSTSLTKSVAYIAKLPLSSEVRQTLQRKLPSSSEAFFVGDDQIVVVKPQPKTVREHQTGLRTNLNNWGVALPPRMTNYIELMEPGEAMAVIEQGRATSKQVEDDEVKGLLQALINTSQEEVRAWCLEKLEDLGGCAQPSAVSLAA